jgi:hypothetical protein
MQTPLRAYRINSSAITTAEKQPSAIFRVSPAGRPTGELGFKVLEIAADRMEIHMHGNARLAVLP